jgi:hypothetical protein
MIYSYSYYLQMYIASNIHKCIGTEHKIPSAFSILTQYIFHALLYVHYSLQNRQCCVIGLHSLLQELGIYFSCRFKTRF